MIYILLKYIYVKNKNVVPIESSSRHSLEVASAPAAGARMPLRAQPTAVVHAQRRRQKARLATPTAIVYQASAPVAGAPTAPVSSMQPSSNASRRVTQEEAR